jgi:adenine deaminase
VSVPVVSVRMWQAAESRSGHMGPAISDLRATEVAARTAAFKNVWHQAGCRVPYMGFSLLPLSVIPEIRLTDRGLILCPPMQIVPLFESL